MSDATPGLTEDQLRCAVTEALRDNRDWLRDVLRDALEDIAHDEARREEEVRAHLRDPRVAGAPVTGQA